jgi:S-adenosylmethionine:tRNA-ribosyltransferase-isomerase (queuine synthetase)
LTCSISSCRPSGSRCARRKPRDAARLLVVPGGALARPDVRDLPGLLRAGDVLVFNDTRVIPAQLEGQRGEARIGATLHKRIDLRRWQAFVRNAKRLRDRRYASISAHGTSGHRRSAHADGSWTLAFGRGAGRSAARTRRAMPLPPYIAGKRPTDAPTAAITRPCSRAKGWRRRRAHRRAAFHARPDGALADAGIGTRR